MAAIFEYMEVFYDRQRIHTALGGLTPSEIEDIDHRRRAQPRVYETGGRSVLNRYGSWSNGFVKDPVLEMESWACFQGGEQRLPKPKLKPREGFVLPRSGGWMEAPAKRESKTGRNAPCPCGSGKKLKNAVASLLGQQMPCDRHAQEIAFGSFRPAMAVVPKPEHLRRICQGAAA